MPAVALLGTVEHLFDHLDIDVESLSDAELTDGLREIEVLQQRLDARRIALLAEWDRRGVWARDGSHSAAARLARETGCAQSTARERVRIAGALRSAAAVAAAFELGELGWSKVRLLLSVVNERTADAFARDEALLVEQARRLTTEHLGIVLRHWQRLVDEDGANADSDTRRRQAFLDIATSWQGEGFLKGRLDPESAAIVKGGARRRLRGALASGGG